MADFKPDEGAIKALVYEDFVRHDIRERADRVVRAAKDIAPVVTGRYRDSIHAEDGPEGSVEISSGVEYAIYIEYGTRYDPAQHILGTALDAARG
jgi:hypothetical protein